MIFFRTQCCFKVAFNIIMTDDIASQIKLLLLFSPSPTLPYTNQVLAMKNTKFFGKEGVKSNG